MTVQAMQERKTFQPCSIPKEALLGSWTVEQLRSMAAEFNSLKPSCEMRSAILRLFLNAQKIHYLRYSELQTIVPADNIHHDLCFEQIMNAARNYTIDQRTNFSLTCKATPKEWAAMRQQAEQDAAREGKLPKLYERKYPDKPNAIAELNHNSQMIVIKCNGRIVFRIPIDTMNLEIIPAHRDYVDVRITTL